MLAGTFFLFNTEITKLKDENRGKRENEEMKRTEINEK